jgi:hypothetical protein
MANVRIYTYHSFCLFVRCTFIEKEGNGERGQNHTLNAFAKKMQDHFFFTEKVKVNGRRESMGTLT